MHIRTCLWLVLACAVMAAPLHAGDSDDKHRSMEIFGWVERVELLDGMLSVKAKLDTGAVTSSLDATGINRFRRGGKRWVQFTVTDPETGESMQLEKLLERNVRIVRHDGEHQRRPVVKMDICLGGFHRSVEVNLIDRSNFIYPMLLGRSALDGIALIDSSSTFLNAPHCTNGQDDL